MNQPTTQTDSTEQEVKPTAFMLNKNQLFQLAKKYVDEGNVEGFNKAFMFMTPQMFELGMAEAKEAGRQEERAKLWKEFESQANEAFSIVRTMQRDESVGTKQFDYFKGKLEGIRHCFEVVKTLALEEKP